MEASNAIELEDLDRLRSLLDSGLDVHAEYDGQFLLHHAITEEAEAWSDADESLRVSATAYLLARGADPTRRPVDGKGLPPEHWAAIRGHWLAVALFDAWHRAQSPPDRYMLTTEAGEAGAR